MSGGTFAHRCRHHQSGNAGRARSADGWWPHTHRQPARAHARPSLCVFFMAIDLRSVARTLGLLVLFILILRRHSASMYGKSKVATRAGAGTTASHADLFERAYFINADDSPRRQAFMEKQLLQAGVHFERWPALRGSPELLRTHKPYFVRGIEKHLYLNRSGGGTISSWGTIGTYLSHHTLFEHILERTGKGRVYDNASFLILQDDTALHPDWLLRLREELQALSQAGDQKRQWARLLLVWWGQSRPRDCRGGFCTVRPPAGPTEPGQPDCCGRRYYHGLQAWIVKTHGLRCLVRRLKRRHIKNIDAQMVQCHCPHTYALPKNRMLGRHLDRELGSERAAVNSVWKAQLTAVEAAQSGVGGAAGVAGGTGRLKKSAERNLRKTALSHLVAQAQRTAAPPHGVFTK